MSDFVFLCWQRGSILACQCQSLPLCFSHVCVWEFELFNVHTLSLTLSLSLILLCLCPNNLFYFSRQQSQWVLKETLLKAKHCQARPHSTFCLLPLSKREFLCRNKTNCTLCVLRLWMLFVACQRSFTPCLISLFKLATQ